MSNNPVSMIDLDGGWDEDNPFGSGIYDKYTDMYNSDAYYYSEFDNNYNHGGPLGGSINADGSFYSNNEQIYDAHQKYEGKLAAMRANAAKEAKSGLDGISPSIANFPKLGKMQNDYTVGVEVVVGTAASDRINTNAMYNYLKWKENYNSKRYENKIYNGVPVQETYTNGETTRANVWKQYGRNFDELADFSEKAVIGVFAGSGVAITAGGALLAYGGVEAGGVAFAGSKVIPATVKWVGLGVCFVKGTSVWTENGQKNIEEIKEGDFVYAYDLKSNRVVIKKVLANFVRETNKLIKLQFAQEVIYTTAEHPFYINGCWIEAAKLKPGDMLYTFDKKKLLLEKTSVIDTLVKVYNFTVEDEHNYYVGKNRVLVHNGCGSNLKLITRSKDVLGHIFRNAVGHVNPSTVASQERYIKLFERVANKMKNLNPNVLTNYQRIAGSYEGFSQTFRNGMQVWVQTTNGKIINAGVNIIPK